MRLAAIVLAGLCLAATPRDLDVGLDRGRPFDFIKTPNDSPTGGGGRPEVGTTGGSSKPAPGNKPGETVTDANEKEKKKQPPPAPPSNLPGVTVPSTADWAQHVNWKPKDDIVDWKDPNPNPTGGGAPTPTGPAPQPKPEPKGADPWNVQGYPPHVPNDLYMYGATHFLQVLLHRPQVSVDELTQFMIDMDYPAYYAATAVKGDGALKPMAEQILQAIGPMVKTPPAKPEGELRQKIYMDLMAKYPYEPDFAKFILSQPTGDTLPVLLHILENEKHPFVLRNAVFVLRCFNNLEVVDPLYKQLSTTKDAVIRTRALIALMRWGHAGALKWAATKLKGADSFKSLAVWAIGRIALVTPVDADTAEKVMAAAKTLDEDGEFLLSAAPALGQIGRGADAEMKKKLTSLLRNLQRAIVGIKNPHSQGGTQGLEANNDPAGIRAKIINERIMIALALIGDADALKWFEEERKNVHITNSVLADESRDLIKEKK